MLFSKIFVSREKFAFHPRTKKKRTYLLANPSTCFFPKKIISCFSIQLLLRIFQLNYFVSNR